MSAGRPATASTRAAFGCSILFLLPFAAGGLFAATKVLPAVRAGDWQQAGLLAVFALAFGGVGVGGIAGTIAGRRRVEGGRSREARHPAAPWLWREDWASRRIGDSSRSGMWGAWIFTGLWNLISLPSAVLGAREALERGHHAALLVLIFPVVGVGLLVWAVRATLRYRRFGVSVLELSTLPAAIGHVLEGQVRTPPGLRPAAGFRLVLSCVRRVTSGGRNRSTSESIVWQDERRSPAGGLGVPVAFVIPADAVASTPSASGTRILWRLEVGAELPGVDYAAVFEVPVFRTAASDQPRTAAERTVASAFAVSSAYRQPAGSRIDVRTTRRGIELDFPRARNPGMAAGLSAFGVSWAGAVWATLALHAPLIFPLVFGGFGLLLAYAVLDAWLGVTRVRAGDGQVTVATGWVAPRRERTLRATEIAEVTTRIGAQAGRATYYDVVLVTTGGKRVTSGGAIRDKREAEWLAERLRVGLGLPSPGGSP